METHVKVVGWLHIVLSALLLLVAGIVFLAVFGGGMISGDRTAIFVTLLVSIFVSGLLVVLAAPGLIAGIGLLQFKPWARILALVLAVFDLINFPLGTLLGIYTFIALLSTEGARLFQPIPDMVGSAAAMPASTQPGAVTTVLPPEPPAAIPTVPAPEPSPAVTTVLPPEPESPESEPLPPAL
jgi:hypothetical protein